MTAATLGHRSAARIVSHTLCCLVGCNGKSPNGQFFDHHIQYVSLAGQRQF
jgi:hypothetical protein